MHDKCRKAGCLQRTKRSPVRLVIRRWIEFNNQFHIRLQPVTMFQQVVDPTHYEVELLTPRLLTSEVVALVTQTRPVLLCIGAVMPGGVPHLRFLCKQLRARVPALRIVVGCWGDAENLEEIVALLRADGIDEVGTTLQVTCHQVMQASHMAGSLTPVDAPRVA